MKYEISQGQYVDFLNSLANDQATARNPGGAGNRYTITGSWPNFTATAPNRACNFLSWDDLLGYLDWAGLSPMTETEFEKCARGPIAPIANEYAWGTNGIVDANTLVNDGTPTEGASDAIPGGSGIANYNGNVVDGPIRVGFAATGLTNRMSAGAGYYGIMDLSGNLAERCVMINEGTQSTAFAGANGDGELTNSPGAGFANAPSWPTTANSVIARGGSWAEAPIRLQTSDRGGVYNNNTRLSYIGGRGVRR
jgi:formylglycine-generating enzyme required for sulfatase activity